MLSKATKEKIEVAKGASAVRGAEASQKYITWYENPHTMYNKPFQIGLLSWWSVWGYNPIGSRLRMNVLKSKTKPNKQDWQTELIEIRQVKANDNTTELN